MATEAQIAANRENAQHSTGPKTEAGKSASCKNNLRWGFTGTFCVLASEDQEEFDALYHGLRVEHRPVTVTEQVLVERMAQAVWLSRRAQLLQDIAMGDNSLSISDQARQFALFLRYQTTNDRAFHKCLDQLLKLRAEKRKAEIGFESQQHRRERAEALRNRERQRADRHEAEVMLVLAKADRQAILNLHLGRTHPHPLASAAAERIAASAHKAA